MFKRLLGRVVGLIILSYGVTVGLLEAGLLGVVVVGSAGV